MRLPASDRPGPGLAVERRADGVVILSSGQSLDGEAALVIDHLQRAGLCRPDVTFLAQRREPGRASWQRLTYAGAWACTGAVASWLIAQGFGPAGRPLAILSDNSLESAVFLFGALRAGALVAPIPSDYSLAGAFGQLDHALAVADPALVFAQDSQAYGAALDRAAARGARLVTVDGGRGIALAALTACSIDASVAERRGDITAATPAKILLAASSTGLPKAALITHGNLAAAAEMTRAMDEPPDEGRVAAPHDCNARLGMAGSLYVDDGPFKKTLQNPSERLPFASGWGMAETTGVGILVRWDVERARLLGLPLPGALVKLVPAGDRYEVRVKGPHIMAGYHKQPDASREAFDEEGFFRTGDAARWADEADPQAGIAVAGRLAEEFKLASGA